MQITLFPFCKHTNIHLNFIPFVFGRQTTPTSSLWSQVCLPIFARLHSKIESSHPLHEMSRSQMGCPLAPFPKEYCFTAFSCPSIRQITCDYFIPQLSLHTVPQTSPEDISTRPSLGSIPSTSLTAKNIKLLSILFCEKRYDVDVDIPGCWFRSPYKKHHEAKFY